MSEGKSVPQEVLADYPDLQKPAQENANHSYDNADVSNKGENAPSLVNWRTAFKNASDDVFKQNDILRGIADISKSASELDDVVNLLAKIKKDHGLDVASTAYAVFVNKYSSKEAKQKSDDMSEHMRPAKKGENVDTYHQQTIDEFLSDAKKELGADFDGLKPSLINEHYQSIEDHIKDGGKISQAVYDSLEAGKQHHFNKTFGAENVIDDGTRQAELDKLNKISDAKLAKDNEAKDQEEKEFADKKNAVAIHQADETVRMAQYDVDHYGASESNQLKLDQAIKSRDALGRADNTNGFAEKASAQSGDTAKPEWHIDMPKHGLAILPAELKGEGYRTVAGRIAKDAVEAITQNQKIANDTLYLYFFRQPKIIMRLLVISQKIKSLAVLGKSQIRKV